MQAKNEKIRKLICRMQTKIVFQSTTIQNLKINPKLKNINNNLSSKHSGTKP
jgi:hypothetical protein